MEATLTELLSAIGTKVFWVCATCFVVLNGAAVAAFVVTRSRRLVDDWTPRLVAADTALLGAGLGVPLLTGLAKVGVHAVASLFGGGPVAR